MESKRVGWYLQGKDEGSRFFFLLFKRVNVKLKNKKKKKQQEVLGGQGGEMFACQVFGVWHCQKCGEVNLVDAGAAF